MKKNNHIFNWILFALAVITIMVTGIYAHNIDNINANNNMTLCGNTPCNFPEFIYLPSVWMILAGFFIACELLYWSFPLNMIKYMKYDDNFRWTDTIFWKAISIAITFVEMFVFTLAGMASLLILAVPAWLWLNHLKWKVIRKQHR